MMVGHLTAQGIRVQRRRVQESMRRVDPQGVLMRSLQLNPRRRRKYTVPAPNSLWHIDGNHKLIRIERLWRDVYAGVLDLFYTIFTNLENEGLLNPDDEMHLYALHRCFMPHVEKHLQFFQDGWNHHKLRTEGNRSPIQLWESHQPEALQDPNQVDAMQYGIDWTEPCGHHEPGVVIPEVQMPHQLTQQDAERFPNPDVPLADVLEVYRETVALLSEMID